MSENGYIRKLRLISKFVASETGQQIIVIRKLPNNSKTSAKTGAKTSL